jgi:hypothetical protein
VTRHAIVVADRPHDAVLFSLLPDDLAGDAPHAKD